MYLPETKAIFAFFEMIALAFAFGGAERLLDGKSLLSVVGAWLAAVAFFVAGIKGSWLRSKIAASGILANVPKFYRDSRFWLGGRPVFSVPEVARHDRPAVRSLRCRAHGPVRG